ncbi:MULTISPECIES: DUF397 domain-containing protein [unclassified Streptomyces]|uniref:DUF397 domain-containing protein n=1 Tax=unclassified Streptomyces TaxID=2593676 RepID=UPI0004C26831|nr:MULTISPECIES: DUF397 domain-containing protein [unclassified Streptomyces]
MSPELSWFKSSYSDDQGGECLEVAYPWRKSSHSDSSGSACLEVTACPHTVQVRDSKLGAHSPRFGVLESAWTAFLGYVLHDGA